MIKYGTDPTFKPEERHPLNIDRQSLAMIPHHAKVLDIGCSTGFMGAYLAEHKSCEVSGLELNPDEAALAKKRLAKVYIGNAEDEHVLAGIHEKFDVVLASAIIEHLADPWMALQNWKKLINHKGVLIITTPNVAHWSMRLHLLFGKFTYEDFGIRDRTHLRFFTYKTFPLLLKDSGYKIEEMKIDPVGGGFPKVSLFLSKFWPNLFAYQMVIKARPH